MTAGSQPDRGGAPAAGLWPGGVAGDGGEGGVTRGRQSYRLLSPPPAKSLYWTRDAATADSRNFNV